MLTSTIVSTAFDDDAAPPDHPPPCSSSLAPTPHFLRHLHVLPLSCGSTSSRDPHFMVKYLLNSCGFSEEEASKASKHLAHLRSTENPDAVLAFFRSQGIDGANLRKMISSRPTFLCCNVESNLTPKFQFLRDLGSSQSDLVHVIVRHPVVSFNVQRTLLLKLNVWENLFGSRELLLKNVRKWSWFL
ncbi:hypothetical protein ZIOFF_069320 [Zingiber officinale]|uniref:Uncharacterized protein n=1 Tax=Zingiber officinale TaxID=94328 RepID=A0A8J5C5S7_ZINOF|nr:hypothetical protein ZIOFF_069320 [Zingiber officinale]